MLETTRAPTPRIGSSRAASGVLKTGTGLTIGSAGVGDCKERSRTSFCVAGDCAAGVGVVGAGVGVVGAGVVTCAAGAGVTGAEATGVAAGADTTGAEVTGADAAFGVGGTPPRGAPEIGGHEPCGGSWRRPAN